MLCVIKPTQKLALVPKCPTDSGEEDDGSEGDEIGMFGVDKAEELVEKLHSFFDVESSDDSGSDSFEERSAGDSIFKKTKIRNKAFQWHKEPFNFSVDLPDSSPPVNLQPHPKPFDYFKKFVNDDLIQMITDESNRYGAQKGSSPGITTDDIRKFIAIQITMSIARTRSLKIFWDPICRMGRIADLMSLNEYTKIKSCLHFANNDRPHSNDKFFKIRPVVEHFRQKFLNIEGIERKYLVKEVMTKYKKIHRRGKWGFKLFVRSGASGIVYDFFLYEGEETFRYVPFNAREIEEEFPTKCVLALCKSIKDPALSAVFLNEEFSSAQILSRLRYELGILSLGPLKANRLEGAEKMLANNKDLRRKGRGSYDGVCDNQRKVAIVKWVDREVVTLGSSYAGVEPVEVVNETDKEQVLCPKIVREASSFFDGDAIKIRRTPLHSYKWYMSIFAHLIDISMSNAYLLYTVENPQNPVSLHQFKLNVGDALVHNELPTPTTSRHLPKSGKSGRCHLCHIRQTIWTCAKCKRKFCLTPQRNCFLRYHIEPSTDTEESDSNDDSEQLEVEDWTDCSESESHSSSANGCEASFGRAMYY